MISFAEFYKQFLTATVRQEKKELVKWIEQRGYGLISEWFLHLEKELKKCDETDFELLQDLFIKGKKLLWFPEKFSPLWKGTWENFQLLLDLKKQICEQIPEKERQGEWQVLFHNPLTNDGITTHSQLSFPEAAFLYAKYRKGLHPKEWIRLQQVKVYMAETGDQRF